MSERWLNLEPHQKLLPAIDTTDVNKAERFMALARDKGAWAVKVGLEIIGTMGYEECAVLTEDMGLKRVVDLKWYGISHTLALALSKIAEESYPPIGVTVATKSGVDSLRTVKEIMGKQEIKVFGVGHLTSISHAETEKYDNTTPEQIIRNEALRGLDAEIEGMVCSGEELSILKQSTETSGLLTLVTGLRSEGVENDDQSRVSTPFNAICGGATAVTMGRQILNADNPSQAYEVVLKEIEAACYKINHND